MQWDKRGLGSFGLMVGLLSVSACTPTPSLAGIETSFSRGTVEAGATAPSINLSKNAFNQHVRQAVQNSPNVARSDAEVGQANQNSTSGNTLDLSGIRLDRLDRLL